MADIDYMHVCDYAFLADGKKPSMIGIFDNITSASFPATHPHMTVAMKLQGQPHELIPITVELGRPNGEVLATTSGTVNAGPDGGAFLNVNLIAIPFPEPGRYTVKVLSSGKPLATRSLRVQKIEQPKPQQAH